MKSTLRNDVRFSQKILSVRVEDIKLGLFDVLRKVPIPLIMLHDIINLVI